MKSYSVGIFYVLISAIGFSVKSVLVKLCYQSAPVDAVSLLALRMLFAFPFFIISLIWQQSRRAWIGWKDFGKIFFLAMLGYYLASIADFLGLRYVSASLERIIVFTYPTFVFVITYVLYRKTPKWIQLIALVLTYFGILIAYSEEIQHVEHTQQTWKGVILIFGSSLSYAFYLVGCGSIIPRIGSGLFTAYAMGISCFQVLLHSFWDSQASILGWTPLIYGYTILMGVLCTVIPTFALSKGIALLGSGNASLIAGLGPILTIGLAHHVLEEKITFLQIVGSLLVIVGVLIISLGLGKQEGE
ncbi:MAG: DMT family transporter [Cytophagales bacterium]|nr:DMT family transporter [Cytophagales bacterium]MDW8384777.1 DMT family transporter [Flammeovirgaceae bacterium]